LTSFILQEKTLIPRKDSKNYGKKPLGIFILSDGIFCNELSMDYFPFLATLVGLCALAVLFCAISSLLSSQII
jgi:hypothetical protein